MGCICAEDRHRPVQGDREKEKSFRPPVPASSKDNPFHNLKLLQPGAISRRGSISLSNSIATPRSSTGKTKKRRAKLGLDLSTSARRLNQPLSVYIRLNAELWTDTTAVVSSAAYKKGKQDCVVFTRLKPKGYVPEDAKRALESVRVLRSMNYPQILRVKEVLEDKNAFYVITEEFPKERLRDYLAREGVMEEGLATQVILQILTAVQYCHSRSVILRNLSTSSFLVSSDFPANPTIKLCDFEEVRHSRPISELLRSSEFVAPEAWADGCSEKSDVWSCGILTYRLLLKETKAELDSGVTLLSEISRKQIAFDSLRWKSISAQAKSFVQALLRFVPGERPSVLSCLNHPWLRDVSLPVDSQSMTESITNLMAAKEYSEIKNAFTRFIIERIVKSEKIMKLAQTFRRLDVDCDGQITEEELMIGLKKIMPENKVKAETDRIMATSDRDKSGKIDYTEFLQSAYGEKSLFSSENLIAAFNSLDKDDSGKISLEELKDALEIGKGMDQEVVWRTIMAGVDTSGDGEIDFQEFLGIMKKVIGTND